MNCFNCTKPLGETVVTSEPNRHLMSPNSTGWGHGKKYLNYYCSWECKKQTDQQRYRFFAELDRNASDSECFQHNHWEKDHFRRMIRVGTCKITGKEVKVEPLQPGNNSGQPIECYEHFLLRSQYAQS